jgi:hypothetical protein
MSWLAKLWAALKAWFGHHFPKLGPRSPAPVLAREFPRYSVAHAEEEPDDLAPMVVYAIGEGSHLWHIAMLCPCGCGAKIQLNTLPDDNPCWTLLARDGVPTLRPSVWRKVGCRSHFILRDGRINWC